MNMARMRQFRYMLLPTGATLADAEERWHKFLNFGGVEPPDLASAVPFVPENWMEATKSIQQLREMAREALLAKERKEMGIVEGAQGQGVEQGEGRTEFKRLGDESEEMKRLNKAWQRRQKLLALGKTLSSDRQLGQTQEPVNSNADGTKEQAEKRGVIGPAMLYEDGKESNRAGFMEFVAQLKQKGLDSLAEAEESLKEGGAAEDILDTPATSTTDAELAPLAETLVKYVEEKCPHPETSSLQDKASSSSDQQTSSSSDTSSTLDRSTPITEATHSNDVSAPSEDQPLSAAVTEKEPSEVIEEVDGEDVPLSDSKVTDGETLQSPVVEKADDQEPSRAESPQVATASPISPASSSPSPTPEPKEGSS